MNQVLIFMFLIMIGLQSSLFGQCQRVDGTNGNEYLFCTNQKTWQNAQNDCLMNNMNLVTINDFEEEVFISNYFSIDSSYWIGLNDIQSEGIFTWIDGTTELYTNWNMLQPDNTYDNENCVELRAGFNYEWNDNTCDVLNYYICEGIKTNDSDSDTILNDIDNCPFIVNTDQLDTDGDLIGDVCDNCPTLSNFNQNNMDNDEFGDACDDNIDGDSTINDEDNCPLIQNDQTDRDNDGLGDACDDDIDGDTILNTNDNCPNIPNQTQEDIDTDNIGNICDNDIDGDGRSNSNDNCFLIANTTQTDTDMDKIGDECDNCINISNLMQIDIDNDGIGDACDDDIDGDELLNQEDNCPSVSNNQTDSDNDTVGDACDNCLNISNTDQLNTDGETTLIKQFNLVNLAEMYNIDVDSKGNIYVPVLGASKVDKYNSEGEYLSSLAVSYPFDVKIDKNDNIYVSELQTFTVRKFDKDGLYLNSFSVPGSLQTNDLLLDIFLTNNYIYTITKKGIFKFDYNYNLIRKYNILFNDIPISFVIDSNENMYVSMMNENSILKYNSNGILVEYIMSYTNTVTNIIVYDIDIDENDILYFSDVINKEVHKYSTDGTYIDTVSGLDSENLVAFSIKGTMIYILQLIAENSVKIYKTGDSIGDVCDNCVNLSNEEQSNTDNDTLGDLCDDDIDNDNLLNSDDNCPYNSNNTQVDTDLDLLGDACDDDIDGDTVLNNNDNCDYIADVNQTDTDNDGLGNICDDDIDGDTVLNNSDNCVYDSNVNQIDIDEDNIGDACDNNFCSLQQQTGECPFGKICDLGICIDVLYACSLNHTDGYCEAGYECVEGVCSLIDTEHECSVEYPNGLCEEGKFCDNGVCTDIVYACSPAHTDGLCEAGYECVEGVCVIIDTEHECSAQYPNGLCEEGKFCDNGVCTDMVYACSPAHTDGLCQSGYECKEGVCTKSDDTTYSGSSADGCSYAAVETRQCLVFTEGIMLFMMMIGLLIKRKTLKTK